MVGTELIFDRTAALIGQTRRRLVMERVRLIRKNNTTDAPENVAVITDDSPCTTTANVST